MTSEVEQLGDRCCFSALLILLGGYETSHQMVEEGFTFKDERGSSLIIQKTLWMQQPLNGEQIEKSGWCFLLSSLRAEVTQDIFKGASISSSSSMSGWCIRQRLECCS